MVSLVSWMSGGSHVLVDQAAQDRFSAHRGDSLISRPSTLRLINPSTTLDNCSTTARRRVSILRGAVLPTTNGTDSG